MLYTLLGVGMLMHMSPAILQWDKVLGAALLTLPKMALYS